MLKFIFFTVLLMSAAGACASVLILALSRILGERLTYSARYYLGAAAVAVMLVPVLPINQLPKQEMQPAQTSVVQQKEQTNTEPQEDNAAQSEENTAQVAENTEVQMSEAENSTKLDAAVEPDTELPSTNYENKRLEELFREFENSAFPIRASKKELYIAVLGVLWIFGAMLMAARYIIGAVWFRVKIFCFSHPASREKRELIDELKREFKIRRKIRLRVFMGDMSPFITGIFANTVYIPAAADEETLRLVLRHELTHCKRLDLLYKGLTELAVILHFFNPFAYILKSYVNKYCELSCDELAVEDMDFEDRKRYTMAMLTMIKKSRYRLHGAAALGEKKSNLRERVEFIMKDRKYSKRTKLLSRSLIAATIAVSTLFGGLAQANNSAEPPKLTYKTDDIYMNISNSTPYEYDDCSYSFSISTEEEKATLTDVAGQTSLYISFKSEPMAERIAKEREFINSNGRDAYFNRPYKEDELPMTDLYEISLKSIESRLKYLTESMVGYAEIKKNGSVIADNQKIFIEDLPGSSDYKYATYSTSVLLPSVMIDGEEIDIQANLKFEKITSDDRIKHKSVKYNFERSRSTKEVYLSEMTEAKANGKSYHGHADENGVPYGITVSFNEKSQNAEMFMTLLGADDNDMYQMFLSPYRTAKVSGGTVKADFLVTPPQDRSVQYYEEKKEVKPFTITGLDGAVGSFVEVRSDDGEIYAKYKIGTKPKEKTELKGTRDVSEFIVPGEEYFVGTPAEQEDFDRDDHDRLYKRIVVDDEGKVIFVIPIENQMPDTLHAAEDKLNDKNYDDGYVQAQSYEGMAYRILSDEDMQAVVKIDDLTWWATAILTRENCFAQKPDSMDAGVIYAG